MLAVIDLRLRHFAKTKDPVGCRATAEMWQKLKRTDADSLYNAACFCAVTAAVLRAGDKAEARAKDAAAEADRAMGWLKQAVAAGYNDDAHMAKDETPRPPPRPRRFQETGCGAARPPREGEVELTRQRAKAEFTIPSKFPSSPCVGCLCISPESEMSGR